MDNRKTRYWVWLSLALGPGCANAKYLLERFSDAEACYRTCEADPMALRVDGVLSQREVERLEATPLSQADAVLQEAERLGQKILTPEDEAYPPLLREIEAPPLALYLRGEADCLHRELTIGMVGTRKVSPYGMAVAEQLAMQLVSYDAVVVSGLARGVDTCSHKGALKGGGKTVAVLGCGLDVDYPRANAALRQLIEQNGALLSEYPPGTPPLAHHFPMRNRILSGLCRGVVVVESDIRSGSQITVGHALTQGRDVFAVPGSIFEPASRGPNRLLQQGSAKLICCAQDILEEYLPPERFAAAPSTGKTGADAPKKPEPPAYLSVSQREIYAILDYDPIGLDELISRTGLTMFQIFTALTELEIFGLIKTYPGKRFGL